MKHNPEFYNKKHEDGYLLALKRVPWIMKHMDPDRFQASHFLHNMIKALSMMPWQNTVEEWQRMEEAKIILKIRRR